MLVLLSLSRKTAMKKQRFLPLLALILGVISLNIWADGVPKPGEVLGTIEYFKETETLQHLKIREVKALPDSLFRTQDPCCNIGLSKKAVWFRFQEKNTRSLKEDFLVEVVNPSIESLHFYQINHNLLVDSFVTGASFKFWQRPDTSSRSSNNRNFVFPAKNPKRQYNLVLFEDSIGISAVATYSFLRKRGTSTTPATECGHSHDHFLHPLPGVSGACRHPEYLDPAALSLVLFYVRTADGTFYSSTFRRGFPVYMAQLPRGPICGPHGTQ
jgi:hypothetical protein